MVVVAVVTAGRAGAMRKEEEEAEAEAEADGMGARGERERGHTLSVCPTITLQCIEEGGW